MIPVAPVLRVLLALPFCQGRPQDVPRLETIAAAIATASNTRSEAIALLTIGQVESAWCLDVHAGQRQGGDGRGLWQLEPGSHRRTPFVGVSLEATTHAAGEALWLWRHSFSCGPGLAARFRVYGGLGRDCGSRWAGAQKRANLYAWISWKWEKP